MGEFTRVPVKESLMKTTQIVFAPVLATALALASAGCRNTAEGVKKDVAESAEKAKDAASEAAQKAKAAATSVAAEAAQEAKEVGQAAAAGAKETAQKAAETSKSAAAALAAATTTFDVKASLLAEASIDAAHINVDTDAKTKTVILKGSVPTAQQKEAAEKLAISKAAGYKVVNQLVVAPKK